MVQTGRLFMAAPLISITKKSSLKGGLWGCRLLLFSGSKMANIQCQEQTATKTAQEMHFVLGRKDKF